MTELARKVHVLGAGGHAKAVISALRAAGREIAAVYDDDPTKWGHEIMGLKIVGPIESVENAQTPLAVIAIGDNRIRKGIADRLSRVEWAVVVDPSAHVDPSVTIGTGSVILSRAAIQPEGVLGRHCILNTQCGIGHDCDIGDFVHVAVGVTLGGGVRLGEGTLAGLGSVVLPGVRVGRWCLIAAGAVVRKNLRDFVLAAGSPAHALKDLDPERRKRR